MNPMKSRTNVRVLRIIARMNLGGPAIQITGLMQNLPKSEFQQVLIYGNCGPDEVDYLSENSIELPSIHLEGFGRRISVLSDIKVFLFIRKQIKSFNPDIIHTHTAKAGFLGRLAAMSLFHHGIRVHTYHGHLLHGYFGPLKTKFVIWAERFLANHSDSLIAVGAQVRDELIAQKIGVLEKYKVINPGLEIGNLPGRKSSLENFKLSDDKFTVSWIGRAVIVKAPQRVIEVAKECQIRGLKIQFVLVGDGPLLDELKDLAKRLDLPIVFLGWQSQIEPILSFSDLVILTSENEGTPVALIQAQMAGIPVLTTDVGSASEVLINEESGFCATYSIKDFSDKIESLARNPQLRKAFSDAGKKNAQQKFSLSRLVADHELLYHNLINQSKFSSKVQA